MFARRQQRGSAAAVLRVADDVAVGPQLNAGFGLACLDEDAMQIAAVDHGIGISEPFAEPLGEIDMRDFLGGVRIHQPQSVDEHGDRSRGVTKFEPVEGVEGIGAELDAGADFLVAGSTLENDDPNFRCASASAVASPPIPPPPR